MKNKLTKIILLLTVVSILACNLLIVPVSAAQGDTITLKAGTYRFNDEVVINNYLGTFNLSFTSSIALSDDNIINLTCDKISIYKEYSAENFDYTGLTYVSTTPIDQGNGISSNDVIVYLNGDLYGEVYNHTWLDDNAKSHTIIADTEVDYTFGEWYIANTNYNEVNGSDDVRMLIKAGRYLFNDTLSFSTSINETDYNNIHFTYNNSEYHGLRFISQSASGSDITTMTFLNGNNIADGTLIYAYQVLSNGSVSETYNGYQVDTPVVVDVLSDQEVPIYIALEFLYNVQIVDSGGGTCPTLPELLRDYPGSFDSIVDMLNSTNYNEYSDYINYVRDSAYNDGASSNFGESVLGSTFQMPLHALNQWVLFETSTGADVTMGGVFTAVIALSLLIILLKMFSGG